VQKGAMLDNGTTIIKHGSAAWAHLVGSLRASRQGVSHKARLAVKGEPLCKRRNTVDDALPTRSEHINTTLLEY